MNAHTLTFPLAAALLAVAAGCSSASDSTPNQTARGATAGAATGAVLGGVIGANSSKVSTEQGAAIGAVAGGLAGAAIGNNADRREASATTVATGAPTYASVDAGGYTVQTIPPAPVSEPQETVPPQPSPNAVWIRGHYTYTGNGYQWQPGRWEVPPAGARQYIGPTWQPAANGGYVYVRGHWQ